MITQREQEWESAWSKREELLSHKDQKLAALESAVTKLTDSLSKKQSELDHCLSQIKQMVSDHAKINDEMKFRANASEKRCDDLTKTHHKKEEQLVSKHAQEVVELKDSLTKHHTQEVQRLNELLTETKDKSKRKQGDLQ